ncbi:MAG: DNA polymerase III subunit gamma/tau [Planctomycetes bacterium]|nr:DNA polymerase III subunit gamma/tau [Planctomycetota bacterium]
MRKRESDPTYTVLARRYRPVRFEEVVGQEHVTTTLANAIREGRIGHAYLFAGPRGVGKTSTARLLAKSLNCEKGPTPTPCNACELCRRIQDGTDTDVIEMDAASNNSVEDARDLRDGVRYLPMKGRFKVYILDEAHMLSKAAFNALLKTLEEPPPHVKFIFATTELHKLPDTILSRCQQFDFRRVTSADIVKRLRQVIDAEKLAVNEPVLASIARAARGSMRDAESILDQLVAFKRGGLTSDDVAVLLGAAGGDRVDALVREIQSGNAGGVLTSLDAIFSTGVDSSAFADQMIDHFRGLLAIKACGRASPVIDLPDALLDAADRQAAGFSLESLLYHLQLLLEARRRIKEGADPRIVIEITFVKMAKAADLVPLAEILRAGSPPAPPKPPPPSTANPPAAAVPIEPPEETDPGPVSAEITVPTLRAHWHRVSAEVKKVSAIPGALLEHGKPTRMAGDEVEIALPPTLSMHRDQLDSAKNRQIIEAALQRVFGRRLGVHVVVTPSGPEPDLPLLQRPAAAPADLASDPGVRKVLEKFPGSKIVGIE